jgi:hypothetical protein
MRTTLGLILFWGSVMAVLAVVSAGCGRGPGFIIHQGQLPTGELDEDPVQGGCDKVDFLFVVDNSPSMGAKQANLAASVPGFVAGLEEALGTLSSIHVGVTTTDAYVHNVQGCDVTGGLIVQTGGHNSSAAACGPYATGHAFMTEADPLEESFGCAIRVGTTGANFERPLTAIMRATSEPLLREGACNEGFLRDDALLVLVVVTDEDEALTADTVYDHVVDAKRGFDDNVVVVALVNEPGGECTPDGAHATYAPGVTGFAESFEHAFVGPVCADDYGPTFQQAIETVQRACR